MKKKIDLNQPFDTFLKEVLIISKSKGNYSLTRIYNALLSSMISPSSDNYFKGKSLKEVLETDSLKVFMYRGTGEKGYLELCDFLLESDISNDWPFFRDFNSRWGGSTQAPKTLPKVVVDPVIVPTDPETTVFQINVEGKSGEWKETVNTSREVELFFKGLQAMACFAGLPTLQLPEISKTN